MADAIGQRLRRAFGWSATGNYFYAATQFGALLVITTTGQPADAATFLLALAVTSPVFLTLSMNLRAALASESDGGFSVRAYVGARALTTVLAVAVAACIAVFADIGAATTSAIILMTVAQAVAQVSNLAQGAYLYAEKHKFVALSLFGQGILGYGSFSVVYLRTDSIDSAILALAVGWLASAVLVDSYLVSLVADAVRRLRGSDSPWKLIRKSFPLGLERGATVFASYLPLIALDASAASVATVAAFGVVTQTIRILQVLARSTSFALIPTLSKLYADRRFDLFTRLVRWLLLIVVGIGVVGFGMAVVFGDWLVGAVFGSRYIIDGLIEVVAVSGAAVLLLSLCAASLISVRRFGVILGVRLIAVAITALLLLLLTPNWGAIGAALAGATGNASAAAVGLLTLRNVTREGNGDVGRGAARPG